MGRGGNDTLFMTAAALGAVSGMRSMAGPALLAREVSEGRVDADGSGLARFLASDQAATVLTLLASGEMVADKTSFVPDRTSALPLAGRAVMGSLTAAAFASNRRSPVLLPALVGGLAAVAATFAAFHARRLLSERMNVPDRLLGLLEDAVVVASSRRIAGLMEE